MRSARTARSRRSASTARASVQRLDGDRLLVLRWDGGLQIVRADGSRVLVDRSAEGPRVDSTGHRVVFVTRGASDTTHGPREDGRLVRYDLVTGRVSVLVHDANASAPLPIPGSDDVLYVSTVSGVASIWRASLESGPTQLTSVGFAPDDPELDPVYGDQTLWFDEHTLVFTASYESDVLYAFDLRTGTLTNIGPGAHPTFSTDGSVLSGGAFESDACVSYAIGGAS